MKLRRRDVCQTCREHKIGCSGERPSCSQCRHTGRVCAGYPPDFEFVSAGRHSRQPGRDTPRSNRRQKPASNSILPKEVLDQEQMIRNDRCYLTWALPPTLQDAVNMIVRSYVPNNEIPFLTHAEEIQPRICGGWVATLPNLAVDRGEYAVLPAAIKTLALSIASKKAQQTVKNATLWHSYGSTLGLLRQSLRRGDCKCDCEQLAALMCLTLTELLLGKTTGDWMVHIDGISGMFRHLGPAFFAHGVPHKLLIGFRPLLVLKSIISRKTSFLVNQSWKTVPFRFIPASPMQELLTEAVNIPSVLQHFDLLPINPLGVSQNHADDLQNRLQMILQRLNSWKDAFESKSSGPLYWPSTADTPRGEDAYLWFDNVAVANALTHYWAFTAICLVHVQKLRIGTEVCILSKTVRQQYIEPLLMVCRSIPFLFQESHNLYGPSSVAFLLTTVVSIFKWDEELNGSRITINTTVIDYAKDQGFYLIS